MLQSKGNSKCNRFLQNALFMLGTTGFQTIIVLISLGTVSSSHRVCRKLNAYQNECYFKSSEAIQGQATAGIKSFFLKRVSSNVSGNVKKLTCQWEFSKQVLWKYRSLRRLSDNYFFRNSGILFVLLAAQGKVRVFVNYCEVQNTTKLILVAL